MCSGVPRRRARAVSSSRAPTAWGLPETTPAAAVTARATGRPSSASLGLPERHGDITPAGNCCINGPARHQRDGVSLVSRRTCKRPYLADAVPDERCARRPRHPQSRERVLDDESAGLA